MAQSKPSFLLRLARSEVATWLLGATPFNSKADRTLRVMGASLGLALVASLDFITGTEISFSIFYVAPILWAAWHVGRRAGLPLAGIAALSWYAAEYWGGQDYSHPLIFLWNTLVRFAFFAGAVEALRRIRDSLSLAEASARIDPLTKLANARAFREVVASELARSQRYGGPLSLAYIDVDNFKLVNDRLGHATGDKVLERVGATLQKQLRRVDVPARLGGDEFAILLPATGPSAAASATDKIHAELNRMVMEQDWPISFSIGLASFASAPSSVDAVIGSADQLMYEVKHQGKNAVTQRTFLAD